MDLSSFGGEVGIKVSSEANVYSPLKIAISTPRAIDFEGNLDVDAILQEQIKLLQTRFNVYFAQTLAEWVKFMTGKQRITSQQVNDKQATSEAFGKDTENCFDMYDNLSICLSIWLPEGVVCASSKPVDELKAALTVLRTRVATALKSKLEEYTSAVNLRPVAIDVSLLALDLELELPVDELPMN